MTQRRFTHANMNERLKLFLKIFVFIVVVFLLGFLLYFFFFEEPTAPSSPSILEDEKQDGVSTLPTAPEASKKSVIVPREELPKAGTILKELPPGVSAIAQGGVSTYAPALIEGKVDHLTLGSSGGEAIFYNPPEGRFYRILPSGEYSLLSDTQFFSVQNVSWAPDAEKAIMEYPDGSKLLYNFSSKEQVPLPEHWENFDFAPNSNEIVGKSIGIDRENRWLMVLSADGKKSERIESIGENADRVTTDWSPNQKVLALLSRDQDFDRQKVYPLGRNQENFKAFLIEGRGFVSQWSPDGSRLFYSVYSSSTNLSPMLWAVDATPDTMGANRIRIPLQTWADKCTIASKELAYCGVPKTLPEGSGIVREVARTIPDDLYIVNYKTGTFSLLASFSEDMNITSPSITRDGRYIFFVDGLTNKLRRVQLK